MVIVHDKYFVSYGSESFVEVYKIMFYFYFVYDLVAFSSTV